MNIFFTSDLHFGCVGVYSEYGHPFPNYATYEHTIIENINSMCQRKDILYIVGDALDYNGNVPHRSQYLDLSIEALCKLQCRTRIIPGNNEERICKHKFDYNWKALQSYFSKYGIYLCEQTMNVGIESTIWQLNHYIDNHAYDRLNLYGHCHREKSITSVGINTSITLTGYYRLSTKQLKVLVRRACAYSIPRNHIPKVNDVDFNLYFEYDKILNK